MKKKVKLQKFHLNCETKRKINNYKDRSKENEKKSTKYDKIPKNNLKE